MRIEVAVSKESSGYKTIKGKLLQELAHEFASTRGLKVVEELRIQSSEIDLHCEDPQSGETIYMECKAHREPLSKRELTNVIGVIYEAEYTQGWLISAGPLGKDAKGYAESWAKKQQPQRSKFRVYYEDGLADLLIKSKLVSDPRGLKLEGITKPGSWEPTWTLLVTEYGRFWVAPRFDGGIATEIYVLDGVKLTGVRDWSILGRLSKLDSSWEGKAFISADLVEQTDSRPSIAKSKTPVIETIEGRRWSDYLPSRPEDFAGRKRELAEILELLEYARHEYPGPRVFAITGESGIGKSSLIACVRGRTRTRKLGKKVFSIAVDCRAAKTKDYINAALVRCLTRAQEAGFGDAGPTDFQVTEPSHPLSSKSIELFLESVRQRKQAICLMFDQFEEVYGKPELSEIFAAAQDLFLSAVSDGGPLVLGFAWRSNFSVQQDHRAYYMWQRLAEHRREITLRPLETAEVNSALTVFEKELGRKLRIEVRRQLIEAASGYPWLMKKLCIHYFRQSTGQSKNREAIESLSVENLFSEDLQGLSDHESSALSFIANNHPIAAFEVIESFGETSLNKLEDQRLVTRSGEMLNIYWDIFREFIVSGTVPDLPFSFLPASPSIGALLSVANQLRSDQAQTVDQIAAPTQLSPRTVVNVVRDLFIIGVATGSYAQPVLMPGLSPSDPKSAMRCARKALSKHTLLYELRGAGRNGSFTEAEICEALSRIPSIPDYDTNNLSRHMKRLTTWFAAAGFLEVTAAGWKLVDRGDVDLSYAEQTRRRSTGPFNGGSSPARALEVLSLFENKTSIDPSNTKSAGYEKAFNTLSRFGLIVKLEKSWSYVVAEGEEVGLSPLLRLHSAAWQQTSLMEAVRIIKLEPLISGPELARRLAKLFGEEWSEGSLKRTGNALRRWGRWLIECESVGNVVIPREGVRGKARGDTPEMMRKIYEMGERGMSTKEIATEVGYSTAAILKWRAIREQP